jgi:ClpP class serine protease
MIDRYFGYWMMEEGKLMAYDRIIRSQLAAGSSDLLLRAEMARQERKAVLISDDYYKYYLGRAKRNNTEIAPVMEIEGPLSRHGECNLGYEDIAGMMRAAAADSKVRVIGLKVDSPGGNVDGVVEAANAIIEARRAGKKVVAWGGFIASAAYFLASQADEVWMDDQKASEIGSIGVLCVHIDQSAKLEREGLKVTILRAEGSENKARFNGIEPLTDEVLSGEMVFLKELRAEFLGFVRRGRSGKLTSNEWDKADMFRSKEAMRIGLADKVGSLGSFLKYLNSF